MRNKTGLIVLVACMAFSVVALARAADLNRVVTLDIEAQPLEKALVVFSQQADIQVVLNAGAVGSAEAPAVKGAVSAREGLDRLLRGSGFRYVPIGERTVSVMREGAVNSAQSRVPPIANADLAQAEGTQPVQPNDGESHLDSGLTENKLVEEIVVTAQKRKESIQDVPISIGVLDGRQLEASGTTGVSEALNRIGGVNAIEREPGQTQISIRGAAAGGPTVSGSSTAGYYLDEAPFAFHGDAFVPDASSFDVERVEVLRGPQGTLYGVNSLNGVVRILTNDANLDEFGIKGRARISSTEDSNDNIGGDLAVNVPLIPGRLGVRAVVSHTELGGYIDAVPAPDFNGDAIAAQDYNDTEIDNYRLKVNAQPTDNLDVELSYTGNRTENTGTAGAVDDYTTPYGAAQGYHRDYDIYSLVVGYDLPWGRIQSATSYIDLLGAGNQDFNIGGGPIVRLDDSLGATVLTEEIRLVTDLEGPWDFAGGVYYREYEDERTQSVSELFPFPIAGANELQDFAVFGEASRWLVNEKFQVTAGVRYFQSTLHNALLSLLFGETPPAPVTRDFEATTWRALVSYFPNDDLTLYASVSTGFRNGFAPSPFTPSGPPITPDTLTNYEVGTKGVLFDGTLRFDTALYYIDWEDAQQLTLNPIGGSELLNADIPLRGFGIDASVTITPLAGLSVYASLGWSGLQFDGASPGPVSLTPDGARPVYSPELTAGAGTEYRFPIGGGGLFEGFVGLDAQYNSELTNRDLSGGVVTEQQSDGIFIGRVRGGFEMEHWTITLFVDNFTDERGTLAPGTLSNQAPYRPRPRTVGLQFAFNF